MRRQQLIDRCEARGFTAKKLAEALKVSERSVERLYSGDTKLHPGKRPELARLIDVSPDELTVLLNDAITPSLQGGWWDEYVTLEQSAVAIRNYEPLLVPGLLQTADYARSILRDDELVDLRLRRQGLITRNVDPIEFTAIIDESVLLRPIGGQRILVEQLGRLPTMADLPNVTLRVIPFGVCEQPASWGALMIVNFPWSGGLVYLEHEGGNRCLSSRESVEAHSGVFDRLEDLALPSADSVSYIRRQLKDLSA